MQSLNENVETPPAQEPTRSPSPSVPEAFLEAMEQKRAESRCRLVAAQDAGVVDIEREDGSGFLHRLAAGLALDADDAIARRTE